MSVNNLRRRAETVSHVFYSLSGGRDSQAALELTIEGARARGQQIELLYVENHSELPGTREHAVNIAAKYGEKLRVLYGKSFEEHYLRLGRWPNSIHKDCIEALINRPLDDYCRTVAGGEDYVLVRGGRPGQRNRYSTSGVYQELVSKPGMIIWNPLYEYPDYQPIGPLWPGYAKGYSRTRCWCCPFALIADWELLKRDEPERWEALKLLFGRLTWRAYRGDGYLRRVRQYWEQQQGVAVPYSYPNGRGGVVS